MGTTWQPRSVKRTPSSPSSRPRGPAPNNNSNNSLGMCAHVISLCSCCPVDVRLQLLVTSLKLDSTPSSNGRCSPEVWLHFGSKVQVVKPNSALKPHSYSLASIYAHSGPLPLQAACAAMQLHPVFLFGAGRAAPRFCSWRGRMPRQNNQRRRAHRLSTGHEAVRLHDAAYHISCLCQKSLVPAGFSTCLPHFV